MSDNNFNIAFNAQQAASIAKATAVDLRGKDFGGISLSITHVATGQFIKFKKFALRTFSDDITTNYSETPVYGRMDPIKTYKGTVRKIKLGIDLIPGSTIADAAADLAAVSKLMSFQYPVYEQYDNALSLSRPPLVRVKFQNYIRHQNSERTDGLLCAMEGCSYSPFDKFDLGSNPNVFTPTTADGQATTEPHLLPQRISVDFGLVVLHEVPVGWSSVAGKDKWIGGANWHKADFDKKYAAADTVVGPETLGSIAGKADLQAELSNQGIPETQQAAILSKVFGF